MLIQSMTVEQTLQTEIEDCKRWFNLEKDESTFKRDLAKRIELLNWVLEIINTTLMVKYLFLSNRFYLIVDTTEENSCW